MSFSVNKTTLLGNLGKDAETKSLNEKTSVTKFSVATVRSYKKGDNYENETTWHNVTYFNASDFIKDKLKKGAKVYVEGRISHNEYTDKEGIKRYTTEIVANDVISLEGKEGQKNQDNTYNQSSDNDLPF
jgi:single-strand DNA-binding protein